MHHIDDHTLELFILGAKSIEDKRGEIEAHLQACEQCRAYAEKVNAFYAKLDTNIEAAQQQSAETALARRASSSLERRQNELERIFYDNAPPVPYRPTTRIEKFRYFTRRHPIAAGSGAFVVLAGLAMMYNVATKPEAITDKNPTQYYYNVEKGLIEIRNAAHQTLWKLSSQDNLAEVQSTERESKQSRTVITDLEGDGTNEALTILPIGNEKNQSHLNIYEADGTLRSKLSFSEEFKYSTRTYSPNFDIASFIVEDVVEKGKKEIWLNTTNVGRSPSATVRLDSKGNVLGKYWHFGNLTTIYDLDLNNDGKKEIILTGINDLNEESYYQYPAIVVLDPSRAVGNGKSTTAPEFGFPFSSAEMYYIRLPLSDLNAFYKINADVHGIGDINEHEIQFDVQSKPTELSEQIIFQYYFNRDMSIREVKSNNTTDRIYNRLVEQGKRTGKIDSAYLTNLKNGVRYWDGKEWRKEAARVRHSGELTATK